MKKVSTGKKKSGPPAHANRTAFVHNRNSRKTRRILAMPIAGLCPACHAVLEWRKRFRKYKPLTVPKRCVRCAQPAVREAYHVVCNACAAAAGNVCCKCLQPPVAWAGEALSENISSLSLDHSADSGAESADGAESGSSADSGSSSASSDDVVDLGSPVRVSHGSASEGSFTESDGCSAEIYSDDPAGELGYFGSDGEAIVLSDLEGLSDGCSDCSSE